MKNKIKDKIKENFMKMACKEWWYKDKNDRCKSKEYFCLFLQYILVINYECMKDFLLIIKLKWV